MQEFNNGRTVISNKFLCGRTLSATSDENVETVEKLLEADRRFTCIERAYELDISHGPAYHILTEHLQMRKIVSMWVPYMLAQTEIQQRLNFAHSLLQRYTEEGDEMLQRIVSIDETCMRSVEPELR